MHTPHLILIPNFALQCYEHQIEIDSLKNSTTRILLSRMEIKGQPRYNTATYSLVGQTEPRYSSNNSLSNQR